MNLLGSKFFPIAVQQHKNSFAYVTSEYGMSILKQTANDVRDFDVLQESLGTDICVSA